VSPELERVCRDLWDMRVRGFVGLKKALAGPWLEGGEESQSQPQTLGSSSSGHVMYSSQAETQDKSAGEGTRDRRGPRSRVKSWRGGGWALPSVVDTLALVYISCVIVRQPVRIGDIVRWAKSGRIPFLGAVSLVMKAIHGRGLLTSPVDQPHAGRVDQTPTKLGPESSFDEICQV
jgi:RNA polymerase I-specific transcription initiation factor RRN7